MKTFKDYSEIWGKTAIYPGKGNNYVYPILGLCGEAGEVSEKIKKVIRDNNGEITEEKRAELIKELGDVLYYVNALAIELKVSLQEIAETNYNKLISRLERNKIQGSGDNR